MEGSAAELWPAIGIDLGTTNSCVAIWRHGRVEIIPNAQGSRTTPSWVAFTPSQRLIGDAAKKQVDVNPTNTLYDCKRLIGRRFSDKIVQNDMKLLPFTVISGINDKPVIEISYKGGVKQFVPEQISSMVLVKMKETAEAYLGSEVTNVVVTVPAYFNNSQRQSTIDAGTIAGLNVMRIINEPTAAAIAYGLANNVEARRNILVFDLGGGTFDVSLVTVAKDSFEVKATGGDTHLGGVDFDNSLVNYFVDKFKRKHNKDINGNHRALQRLRVACEMAKRSLSLITETTIEVDCLYEGVDFSSTLSRDQFEMLNTVLFVKCIEVVKKCLRDAKMNTTDVDDVVLVGGSTRVPMVQQLLLEFFDKKELCKSLDPDEAVASGAAIQAAGMRHNKHFLVSDVTPLSLEIEDGDFQWSVHIPRNTRIPAKREHGQYVRPKDYQRDIDLRVSEVEDNCSLGTFNIKVPAPHLAGLPRVMTTFEIDANSILTVTSVEQHIFWKPTVLTVTEHTGKLSKDEINMMGEEAKTYKMEDMEHMKMEKAKFEVQKFVSNMSDTLSSYGKIKSTYKKKLKYSIQQTNLWLDLNPQLNDARMFEEKIKELQDNFSDENRMNMAKESKMKDMELRKARLDLEKFVSNMSDTLSSYGKIKSTYKKKLKDSIQQTNRWLDLNSQLNDARMFEDKLKELLNNFTDENRMKDAKESMMKDMELKKARLDVDKFVSNMSDTLSSYGKIKSTEKKKLKDAIQQTNRWLDLNSQPNDARTFQDKLKELQDNFTDENRMKEAKESMMKDMELRKARLNLEKFVSNISDNLSNYYNIKSEDKKKLKDATLETNQWLDLNVLLNDASKFEDKLKELQDICNPSQDASGTPKKSSFFFFSYPEDGESSSNVQD